MRTVVAPIPMTDLIRLGIWIRPDTALRVKNSIENYPDTVRFQRKLKDGSIEVDAYNQSERKIVSPENLYRYERCVLIDTIEEDLRKLMQTEFKDLSPDVEYALDIIINRLNQASNNIPVKI